MRTPRTGVLVLLITLAFSLATAAEKLEGLAAVEAEQKLEKRAQMALAHARRTVGAVTKAYLNGSPDEGERLLGEIEGAIEMAKEALDATGKNPSRNPKHFKNLEIGTRSLVRELGEVEQQLSYNERERLNAVRERIAEINHDLLLGIMTKKRK